VFEEGVLQGELFSRSASKKESFMQGDLFSGGACKDQTCGDD
jgi:hypothetical protein